MIDNARVGMWFALQFAIGTGGAAASLIGPGMGVVLGLLAFGSSWATLRMAWSRREQADALKPLSDGVAVAGTGALVMLLFAAGVIPALVAFLFVVQHAMNLILREYRQLYFGLVIGFVLLMVGAAEAYSGVYLVALLAYAIATSICFGEIWLDHRTEQGAGQCAGQVAGRGAGLQRPGMAQRAGAIGMVVAAAIAIYVLLPRLPAGNFGSRQASAPEQYANEQWEREADDNGTEADPGQAEGDDVAQDPARDPQQSAGDDDGSPDGDAGHGQGGDRLDYPGFRSQFDIDSTVREGDRFANGIVAYMQAPHGAYLRMRTFDTFDGVRWHSSNDQLQKRRVERGRVVLDDDIDGDYRQVIEIRLQMPGFLPAAPRPVELSLPATVIGLDAWNHPVLPDPLQPGLTYTVDSRVEWFGGRLVSGNEPPSGTDLQLPPDLDPRIPALSHRVASASDERLQRIAAVENHLRNSYGYTLSSAFDSQGETPLPRFLFDVKRGHCEYFASAMVVMLRTLDIPARLVTGLSATRKNPMTGYFEIRALDGHAWVEAWIPEAGWVTFEPTALYELPNPDQGRLSGEQINDYVESIERTNQYSERIDWTFSQLLSAAWRSLYLLFVTGVGWLKLMIAELWPLLIAMGGIAGGLYITRHSWLPPLRFIRSRSRIKRFRPAEAHQALHYYLDQLQCMARAQGISRGLDEPLAQWVTRLELDQPAATRDLIENADRVFYRDSDVDLGALRDSAIATAKGMLIRRVFSGSQEQA